MPSPAIQAHNLMHGIWFECRGKHKTYVCALMRFQVNLNHYYKWFEIPFLLICLLASVFLFYFIAIITVEWYALCSHSYINYNG